GREIRVTACVTKIGPGRAVALYRGPIEDAAELVAQIGREIRRADPARPAGLSTRPARPDTAGPTWTGEDVEALLAAPGEAGAEDRRRAGDRARNPAASSAPLEAMNRTEGPGAKPLADYIAGLALLRAACPYAPGVELAAGGDGSLHVLASGVKGT